MCEQRLKVLHNTLLGDVVVLEVLLWFVGWILVGNEFLEGAADVAEVGVRGLLFILLYFDSHFVELLLLDVFECARHLTGLLLQRPVVLVRQN